MQAQRQVPHPDSNDIEIAADAGSEAMNLLKWPVPEVAEYMSLGHPRGARRLGQMEAGSVPLPSYQLG